ncbi:MAG: hypothetical protein U0T73_05660 [Chitinophagales bacterium]
MPTIKRWLIIAVFFCVNWSCNRQPKTVADPYQQRVANLLQVIPDSKIPVTADSCFTVYLLQTTRCNVCSAQAMDDLARSSHQPVILFIMADSAANVEQTIKKVFYKESVRAVFVDEKVLKRKGLLFYKNLKAEICHRQIRNWAFL